MARSGLFVVYRLDSVSIPFDAGAKDGLNADGSDAGGANDHVFAGVDFGNGDVDKFFGGGFGHEFGAVPLLEVLNGGETDLLGVPTIESHVDNVFAGSSRHGFNSFQDNFSDNGSDDHD